MNKFLFELGCCGLLGALSWTSCTRANDIYCETSAECPEQQACAIDKHSCTATALTLDSTGFFIDDTRWWASVSGPTLRGTVSAVGVDAIRVFVDGAPVGSAAELVGDQWNVRLPDNTILSIDKPLRIVLTGSEGAVELIQTFALDASSPRAEFASTTVFDEQADVVTFVDSEPIHMHAAMPVSLLPDACSEFSKFGYLMDAEPPTYGKENVRNPLIWRATVNVPVALDPMASRYRLETTAGAVLQDWAALPTASLAGDFSLEFPITRAAVGSTKGSIRLQVEVVDWAGRKKDFSACWTQSILAPPLDLSLLAVSTTGPRGIGTWSLAGSPFASLMNGTDATNIFESTVKNGTSESVTVDFTLPTVAATYTRNAMQKDRFRTVTAVSVGCGTTAAPVETGRCEQRPLAADMPTGRNGEILASDWVIRAIDPQSGAPSALCTAITATSIRCVLPARATVPASLVIVGALNKLAGLAPAVGTMGEFSVSGFAYSGLAPVTTVTCDNMDDSEQVGNQDIFRRKCVSQEAVSNLTYLTRANILMRKPQVNLNVVGLDSAQRQIIAPTFLRGGQFLRDLNFDTGERL